MIKTLMFDTNIYDLIIARRGFTERLSRLVAAGTIDIVRTHVQEDEIGRIPDMAKRARMSKIPGRKISTSGAAWGISRWDEARWGGSGNIKFGDVVRANPSHSEDALIAMTADSDADVLVTEDKKLRVRVTARTSDLEVWNFDQLVHFVDGLPA
jgi:predicted nucleic acid-binding protein